VGDRLEIRLYQKYYLPRLIRRGSVDAEAARHTHPSEHSGYTIHPEPRTCIRRVVNACLFLLHLTGGRQGVSGVAAERLGHGHRAVARGRGSLVWSAYLDRRARIPLYARRDMLAVYSIPDLFPALSHSGC
jgi:hypothetical protein